MTFADKFLDDFYIWEDHISGIDKPVLWEYKNKEKCFYQYPTYKRSDYKILIELTKDEKKIALDYLEELHKPLNEETRQHNNEKARLRRANR
jgi:hypothetical protein